MTRITFRADEDLLDEARRIAREKGTSLNEEIRQWLRAYAAGTWRPAKDDEHLRPPETK